jgi:hypothetical protein
VFSAQNKKENTFLKTKPNFYLTEKCFWMIIFSNSKQVEEILKNNLHKKFFSVKQTGLYFGSKISKS